MLTFLFALAAIWTLFWFVMLILNWDDHTSHNDSNVLCPTCSSSVKPGSLKPGSLAAKSASSNPVKSDTNESVSAMPANDSVAAKPSSANSTTSNTAAGATMSAAASAAADSVAKNPVTDTIGSAKVTPLFEKPSEEADDLKVIKGIGVVMEQTLNDLGITTFKQLAGFQKAEVKMVSDALSESKAGFGDRIERDEWVDQAKALVRKG